MKRFFTLLAPLLLAATLSAGDADAWEAATTHAGLTEQSALSSDLHKRLQDQLGSSQGLYSMLTIPTEDAPKLFAIIDRLNPTHGYVPDASGRTTALSWLVLGSVVADVPAEHAGHHFFNPRTGSGLTNSTEQGISKRARLATLRIGKGPSLAAGGLSAQEWWQSKDNPLGYQGFADQFRKAASAATPGERSRHLAGSLVAAGAMLHVLQDMGSPSHVRDDIAAHQQQIGSDSTDRGSRFERIAALAFGRLGIPAPGGRPAIPVLAGHFSNTQGTGLADIVARSYFSAGTLPRAFKVTRNTGNSAFRSKLSKHLRRPAPSAGDGEETTRFDLVAARNADGATWRSTSGTCLAEYHLENAEVHWSLPDACILEQLEDLMPQVTAYGASFLNALYPSDLAIASTGKKLRVAVNGERYGAGTLKLFSDGADGKRTAYFSTDVPDDATTLDLPIPPASSTRVTTLFDGVDALGNPLLATASTEWPIP